MGRYFGTDGYRGEAGASPSGKDAYKIGAFFGAWCTANSEKKPRILVGKDTRLSSDMLESAIGAGLMSAGTDAYFLGVATTPALAFLVKKCGFDGGVMISASHNVYSDNGIKLFSPSGEKISDAICDKIEDYIDGVGELEVVNLSVARGEKIGRASSFSADEYEKFLIRSAKCRFDGLKIALDCANGSTSGIAERVFKALGADVCSENSFPDGTNINRDCGSTHIESLCKMMQNGNFDAGFAFDGDGDRCIAADRWGRVLDGDALMLLLAKYMTRCGELSGGAIVATVMSNLGLHASLDKEGISCIGSAVGDRFVWENMQKYDIDLGGEQSGHIIIRPYLHTGDGILTAIKSLEASRLLGETFEEARDAIKVFPQTLLNVKVRDKKITEAPLVTETVDKIREKLSGRGRVLLRPSGTEPIIRIMVEVQGEDECREYAEQIEAAIRRAEEEIL